MSFDDTLTILSSLKATNGLFVALRPPFSVSFDVDREVLQQEIERQGLPESEFKRFADQIGMMLAAILDDLVDEYTANQVIQSTDDEPSTPEEVQAALDRVREALYDTHLQQRYDLKKSSKAPSFTDIDWDIKVKYFDAKLAEFSPFPYATCRLSFQTGFEDHLLSLLGRRIFDAVQINLSIDDIDYLTRVLGRIRERLEHLEREYP